MIDQHLLFFTPIRCLLRGKHSPPRPAGDRLGVEGICNSLIEQALILTLSSRARRFAVFLISVIVSAVPHTFLNRSNGIPCRAKHEP